MIDSKRRVKASSRLVFSLIGSQNRNAVKGLDALQQKRYLLIGVTVVGIPGLGALAEQGVGFIKKENPAFMLGLVKDLGQILFGLPDIFGHHQRQVHPVDVTSG